jgi:kumamolisin
MKTNCFRDVQGNSNGAFTADPGYDMVTGMGAPHVKNLIGQLTQ